MNYITATQCQREFYVWNPSKRNKVLALVNKLETTGSLVSEKGKYCSLRLPMDAYNIRARLEQSPKKKKIIKIFVTEDRVYLLNVSESCEKCRCKAYVE